MVVRNLVKIYVKFISWRFATKWMSRRERLEQLGNQPKKFTNVYVKNFGEEMTEADFKELVDSFGKVLSLKVVTSDQGRSKGFGFVSFETPEEAQKVSRQLLFTILSAFNWRNSNFARVSFWAGNFTKWPAVGNVLAYLVWPFRGISFF